MANSLPMTSRSSCANESKIDGSPGAVGGATGKAGGGIGGGGIAGIGVGIGVGIGGGIAGVGVQAAADGFTAGTVRLY